MRKRQLIRAADKAYYLAEYLADLLESDVLIPRTVCEKYEHSTPNQMGFIVTPASALAWARDLTALLDRARTKHNRRR
jgi:hypothetical protein